MELFWWIGVVAVVLIVGHVVGVCGRVVAGTALWTRCSGGQAQGTGTENFVGKHVNGT